MDKEDTEDKANRLKCTEMLAKVVSTDKEVQKMVDSIEGLGCKLPSNFFSCRKCGADITGGFKAEMVPPDGNSSSTASKFIPKVIACENKTQNQTYSMFRNTIVHELVHAYDLCRSNLDTRNCKILACTEIRASAMSGECNMNQDLTRGTVPKLVGKTIESNFWTSYRECVRRRAIRSLDMTSHCKDVSEKAVDVVWDTCYRDEAPLWSNDVSNRVKDKD